MASNANLFVVLSLSSLLIFAEAHQSPSPAPAPAAKSNVNLAQSPRSPSKAPAPAPAAKPKVAVSSISSSPYAAPAPSPISGFEELDPFQEMWDDMKDVGKSIDVIVEETINKIHKKFGQIIDHVINQGLAEDSLVDAGEKQCFYVCKDDYSEVRSNLEQIREEFSKTHDFSMVSDYLMEVVREVRPCQKCMRVYHGGRNPFDQLTDWLQMYTQSSALRLNELLHH